MIQNKLKIITIITLLTSASLMAESNYTSYYNEATSFVSIEGGYSKINTEFNDMSNVTYSHKATDISSLGLKIGAQTTEYRVSLAANYFNTYNNEYDYIATYGAALEYKFNISKQTNMFVGVNGGIANMKFTLIGENVVRTISNPYLGGDVGFDFAISKTTDFELGARYINIQASNIKNSKQYILNDMMSYYMSFIFKFRAD